MTKRIWTDTRIKKLAAEGMTRKAIAETLGMKPRVVSKRAVAMGIGRKTSKWNISKAQLLKDYTELSSLAIARKYNRNYTHLYVKLRGYGIPAQKKFLQFKLKNLGERFKKDWGKLTLKQLALKYNSTSVSSWARYLGLPKMKRCHRAGQDAQFY